MSCSHILLGFFHLTVHSSQSNDPKIKFKLKSHGLLAHCHMFLNIKREMRDNERKRKAIREKRNENQNLTISILNGHNF
jgi:hypothetical protein